MSGGDTSAHVNGDRPVRRVGQVVGLQPGAEAEYRRVHAEVWPEVLATLTAHHVHNYSIFVHGDLLFSYYEYTGDDHEADQASIAADPATQRWWSVTEPLQRRLPGTPDGAWWTVLPEAFHLD